MRLPIAIATLSVSIVAAQAQIIVPETDIILVAPSVESDGYAPSDYAADTSLAETLDDADVYSSITGKDIGEVDDVHAGAGGTILELEIGGFLDIGDKDIAIPIDQVSIYRNSDEYRVYVAATEDQLKQYPEYED